MATARGFPRNEKPGRRDPKEDPLLAMARKDLERALKYLRAELDVLLRTPGNSNEVLRITHALSKIVAEHQPGADHEGRREWSLDLDG